MKVLRIDSISIIEINEEIVDNIRVLELTSARSWGGGGDGTRGRGIYEYVEYSYLL